MVRRCRAALVGLALLIGSASIASAHPHVFVTAASELMYAPDGSLTGVRHAWTFDDMFSAYAIQGIETKTKGVYTREELASLAQTNVESLKEFAFFTFAKSGGRKSKFSDPVDYYLDYNGTALVLHFTLPLKAPLKTKQLALEIFDPSYFVDFSLAKENPIKLVGAQTFFQPDRAELLPAALATVETIGPALLGLPNEISIEGHAASDPKAPTDWELAGARSTAVLRYLVETDGLDPTKIAAVSYGSARPVPGDYALSRRVDIVIFSDLSDAAKALVPKVVATTSG